MDDDFISWPAAPKGWRFDAAGIDVWAMSLHVSSAALSGLASALSAAECRRAEGFYFVRHRDRFVAGRGLLRQVLAFYLRARPSEIEFQYGHRGKPALAGRFAATGLLFNLAHCDDLALVAVSRAGSLGIDVERVRTLPDCDELASRFFSSREGACLRALSPREKPAAFFNIWTRKEAWLKATGEGICDSLDQVEVGFGPAQENRFLRDIRPSQAPLAPLPGRWQFHDLTPSPGFTASLAAPADCSQPACWRWNTEAS